MLTIVIVRIVMSAELNTGRIFHHLITLTTIQMTWKKIMSWKFLKE